MNLKLFNVLTTGVLQKLPGSELELIGAINAQLLERLMNFHNIYFDNQN